MVKKLIHKKVYTKLYLIPLKVHLIPVVKRCTVTIIK